MPYTRSRGAEWLGHIVENIERLRGHLGGDFRPERLEDPLVLDAVERCLERISEATARLHRAGEDLDQLAPEISWSDFREFGNVVRHEYDNVEPSLVAYTIIDALPALLISAQRLQRDFEQDQSQPRPIA